MAELEKPTSFLDEQAQRQDLFRAFERHPVRSAVIVFAIDFVLVTSLPLIATSLAPAPGAQPDLIALGLVSLITVLALSLLRWWKVAGFNPPGRWRNLNLLVLPALVVMLLPWVQGITPLPLADPLHALLISALAAFHAEAVYRGIILRLVRSSRLVRAVVISSLLFGLSNAGNLFFTDQPLVVLAQMACAAAEGVGLAALRIRTHTLWFLILLQAAQYLLLQYTGLPVLLLTLIQSAFFFIFGILILRSRKKKERASILPTPIR